MTKEIGNANFNFHKRQVGYIRKSNKIEGPPVIVASHRRVKPGKEKEMLERQ